MNLCFIQERELNKFYEKRFGIYFVVVVMIIV